MTTTPNPTAERLRELVANLIPLDLIHDRERPSQPQDAFEAADRIIAALRAHGLLSEGAPSDEQIARASLAVVNLRRKRIGVPHLDSLDNHPLSATFREDMRAALAAALAAPQGATAVGDTAVLPTETPESGNVRLDREKVRAWLQREFGSFLAHDPHNPDRFWGWSADALCVAYTEGKLT